MKRKQIHLIYSIILSALLILAAVCLMIACVGIYNAGDQPFSREAVATAFGRISIPIYICLAAILPGFLLDLFLPGEVPTEPMEKPYRRILDSWLRKVDPSLCDPETRSEILRLENRRKLHSFISGLLLGLGSVIFLLYAFNRTSFDDFEINSSVIRAVIVLLASMTLPVCFGIYSAFYATASLKQEIDLLKQASGTAQRAIPLPRKKSTPNPFVKYLRVAVLCAALTFLLLGFFTGGTADVMTKAINICTECVGLG